MPDFNISTILSMLKREKKVDGNEIALAIGITPGTFSNYLKGHAKPSVDVLIKLSDYFNVSVDYLLGRAGKNSYTPSVLQETQHVYQQKKNTEFQEQFNISEFVHVIEKLTEEKIRLKIELENCQKKLSNSQKS